MLQNEPQNTTSPKVLIITGYGLNCEAESAQAWRMAGARPELVHLNDLFHQPEVLRKFEVLMIIGGFSFGDHMGSGHAFALRLKHRLMDELREFIIARKLILGVCNGFQIMVKMGLLPGLNNEYFKPRVALVHNVGGAFQNFWVHVRFEERSPCVFTRGLGILPLPIRHGEGRFFTRDHALLEQLKREGCVACSYVNPRTFEPTQEFPFNPNGSLNAIAGVCDPSGRIFGLMPHPEAYLYPENHPQWDLQRLRGELPDKGLGLRLFENAVRYLTDTPSL